MTDLELRVTSLEIQVKMLVEALIRASETAGAKIQSPERART